MNLSNIYLGFNFLIALSLAFHTAIGWLGKPSSQPQLSEVSICQLARNPYAYDEQNLRLRAILVENHNPRVDGGDSFLYDPRCLNTSFTVVAEWDASNLSGGPTNSALDRIREQPDKKGNSRAEVIVVGRFNGPKGNRYGHLGWARAQFLIVSLESAQPVAANVGWPHFSKLDDDPLVVEEETVRTLDNSVAFYLGSGSNSQREEALGALGDDYLLTIDLDIVKNRRQVLDEVIPQAQGTVGHRISSLRVYNGTAVTTGTIEFCGKERECPYRSYTNVYVKRDGVWKLVASHFTKIEKN